MNNLTNKFVPKLSLYHHNIRSLNKHCVELLNDLKCLELDFDFIALSEIGQHNITNCANFFENYNFYHETSTQKNGGVGCFINKSIQVKSIRNDLKLPTTIDTDDNYLVENLWIECQTDSIKKPLIVGIIYRHPKGNVNKFTEVYNHSLDIVNNENKICVICGDLNINALSIIHQPSQAFYDLNLSENMIPQITLPSRITENSATIIDQVFFRQTSQTIDEKMYSGLILSDLTDHLPNFILYGNLENDKMRCNNRRFIRIHSDHNISKFNEFLGNMSTWEEFNVTPDCNTATSIFTTNIKRGCEQCFPLTKISRKRAKDKEWVTLGIKKSCNHKSSLYKKFLKHPTQENKAKYIKYRNLLSKLCKAAQENYFHDIISETKSSLVKLWETFGPIINPGKRKELHKIEKINKEGSFLTNKKDIANHFNNYFCNIGKKLQNNVPTTNKNYKNYLTNQNLNSFFISPVSEDELLKVIHTINNRKAKGIYDIPANIFKRSFNQIKNPLLSLLNMSFSQGIFPDIFKIAKVIPLYKKQDRYLTENYRPISLLSYISKIFEKLMKKRLCSFLNKYNILYDLQFGF